MPSYPRRHLFPSSHSNAHERHLIAHSDGGARGNPGPAAYGYVLEDEDETVLASHGEHIGSATNDVEEENSLVDGMRMALEVKGPEVVGVPEHGMMGEQKGG